MFGGGGWKYTNVSQAITTDNNYAIPVQIYGIKKTTVLHKDVLADYVVEEGTDGVGWHYRKWSSGKCEAWRYINETSVFGYTSIIAGAIITGHYPTTSQRL